jgi:hypothetical protein
MVLLKNDGVLPCRARAWPWWDRWPTRGRICWAAGQRTSGTPTAWESVSHGTAPAC